jgi:hypothetical protein
MKTNQNMTERISKYEKVMRFFKEWELESESITNNKRELESESFITYDYQSFIRYIVYSGLFEKYIELALKVLK